MKTVLFLIAILFIVRPVEAADSAYNAMIAAQKQVVNRKVAEALATLEAAESDLALSTPWIQCAFLRVKADALARLERSADAFVAADQAEAIVEALPPDAPDLWACFQTAYEARCLVYQSLAQWEKSADAWAVLRSKISGFADPAAQLHVARAYFNEGAHARYAGLTARASTMMGLATGEFKVPAQAELVRQYLEQNNPTAAIAAGASMMAAMAATPEVMGRYFSDERATEVLGWVKDEMTVADFNAQFTPLLVNYIAAGPSSPLPDCIRAFIEPASRYAPAFYEPNKIIRAFPIGRRKQLIRWFSRGTAPADAATKLSDSAWAKSTAALITNPFVKAYLSGDFKGALVVAESNAEAATDVDLYVRWVEQASAPMIRCLRLDYKNLPVKYLKFRRGDPWDATKPDNHPDQQINPIESLINAN